MRRMFVNRRLGIATRHLGWVALGFFGMLLLLAMVLARIGANRLLDATRWYGTLTAAKTTIRLDGRITLTDASFVPHGASAEGEVKAARVDIHTGGPAWLMRLALRRTSADRLERRRKELEDNGALERGETPPVLPSAGQLVIDAREVSMGPDSAMAQWVPWLDPTSGVLFAALGCREAKGLSLAVAQRAGDSGKFDVRLELRQRSDTADLEASFRFGGLSTARWQGKFQAGSKLGLLAGDWRQWQMLEQQWTLHDRSFVRARNRECARRMELGRPQFVARHALAVERQLAEWKVALPDPLEHAYREHASVGGDIVFVSRPRQPILLGEYQLMSRSQKVGALEGEVTVAGRRLRMLLEFLPETLVATGGPKAPAGAEGAATIGSAIGSKPPTSAPPPPGSAVASTPVPASTKPAGTSAAPKTGPSTTAATTAAPAAAAGDDGAPGIGALAGVSVAARPSGIAPAASVTKSAVPVASAAPARPALPPAPAIDRTPAPAGTGLPSEGNYRGLIGRRVTITTTHGTVRTGKVRIANNVAVTLEMQTQNGPIQLRIPAEQIVRVRTAPL